MLFYSLTGQVDQATGSDGLGTSQTARVATILMLQVIPPEPRRPMPQASERNRWWQWLLRGPFPLCEKAPSLVGHVQATAMQMLFLTQPVGTAMRVPERQDLTPTGPGARQTPRDSQLLTCTAVSTKTIPATDALSMIFSQPKAFWNGFTSCSETRRQIFPNMCI